MDLAAFDPIDVEDDQSVVEQQRVAGAHVLRQVLVVEADPVLVAAFGRRVEDEWCTGAAA